MSATFKNQSAFQILQQDEQGLVLEAYGSTVPTDAAVGYATGCIFKKTNGSAGTALYQNEGTSASADFNAIAATGAGSFSSIVDAGNLTFSAASDIIVLANTAAALEVSDGTVKLAAFDTRNTLKNISNVTLTGVAPTVATEAAAHINPTLAIAAKTITYTGTTTTTSSLGAGLHVGAHTWTDASAATLSIASSVHIVANAAAGGMLTITASYMISTSVSGAFLTNAGVWTDMACWESGKEFVSRAADVAADAIDRVLDKITPATWKYKAMTELPTIDGGIHRTPINDRGRERVGIVYDDLPQELRAPGEETAVATGILASFALAALKVLRDENRELRSRIQALESA